MYHLVVMLLVVLLPSIAHAQWSATEPSGSQVISDWNMTSPAPKSGNHSPYGNGWTAFSGNTSAVTDSGDLVSPGGSPNTMQLDFAGTVGGSSPGNHYFNGAAGRTEVFIGYEFSISPTGFVSNPSGTKMFFIQSSNGGWNLVPHLGISGSLSGPFLFELYFPTGNPNASPPVLPVNNCHLPARGASDCPGTVHLDPNVGNGTIQIGTHYKITVYMKESTCPTCQNGIIRAWINDNPVIAHTNVNFPAVPIGEIQINPTWGGTGGTAPGGYFRYGHVHVSLPNCPAPCGGGIVDNPVGPPAAPTGVTAIVQ